MKSIHINGNQFQIGDETRPYKMATSFCLLGYYQEDPAKGHAWLERLKALGFDGPRLFGENQDWFGRDAPFFGNPEHTKITQAFGPEWDNGSNSQLRFLPNYADSVKKLVRDLETLDLIAEFCCIATVKGRDESVTSHGLNRFAQMFRSFYPDPKNTPILHETVNEVEAHSAISMEEAARYGARWRRDAPNDPGHHNYPDSTIGQSSGGRFNPAFNDSQFTHRNIHPPRGPRFIENIGLVQPIDRRPVALNENICVLTQGWWDRFVVTGVFGGNQCTTDHVSTVAALKSVYDRGLSVTLHYGEGMSTNPDLPIAPCEEEFSRVFGSGVIPSAPEFRPIIRAAYQEILNRESDSTGLEHYNSLMKDRLTKAELEEILLRSEEYRAKNFSP